MNDNRQSRRRNIESVLTEKLDESVRRVDDIADDCVRYVRRMLHHYARYELHDATHQSASMADAKRGLDELNRCRVAVDKLSRHIDASYRGLQDTAIDLLTIDPSDVQIPPDHDFDKAKGEPT